MAGSFSWPLLLWFFFFLVFLGKKTGYMLCGYFFLWEGMEMGRKQIGSLLGFDGWLFPSTGCFLMMVMSFFCFCHVITPFST